MISIVTAYYNRRELFINTLKSIQSQNFKGDFEVIAVDDGSSDDERLEDLQEIYPFLKVIYLDPSKKWYKNSCIPFNIGFAAAKGDKVIIQNPECLHYSPIISYVDENLNKNEYLSFGCFSLGKKETNNINELIKDQLISKVIADNNHQFKMDGLNGWYNHSVFRPEAYHFCTAINRIDLLDLGGFDERYANGIGEDDIELVYRIVLKRMKIIFKDDVIALHQNHYYLEYDDLEKIRKEKEQQYQHNKNIFLNVTKLSSTWRVGYLLGQEELLNSKENIIRVDYRILLLNKIDDILSNRYARKIALKFLSVLSSLYK